MDVETLLRGTGLGQIRGIRLAWTVIRTLPTVVGVSIAVFVVPPPGGAGYAAAAILPVARSEAPSARSDDPLPRQASPGESRDTFEVLYDVVPDGDHRLRSIVTKPHGNGPFPALLFVQGLSCGPVEAASGTNLYTRLLYALTETGFVTMRVEKSGVGDSEGPPCSEIDLETETRGFENALRAVRAYPFVDADAVFLFGHSMGGVIGPVIAGRVPVRGIAVFGTLCRTWIEYEFENQRRQWELEGLPCDEVDRRARELARFLAAFYVDGEPLDAIATAHPDWSDWTGDGVHLYGRHASFFRQLESWNLPAAWSRVDAPVLAIWGGSDFVCDGSDHQRIAEIVGDEHPRGTRYVRLDGIDHTFSRATDAKDSYRRWVRNGQPIGEFDARIVTLLRSWMKECLAED